MLSNLTWRMNKSSKNFITHFHNLPGETVKQRHRNWFNFLHEHIELKKNPAELDYITANLLPSTHLEKILYVDFLIYFERFHELYERFKSGEDVTLKKLSKQEWFYQKAFNKINVKDFVTNLLPTTSHSLKLKILHKLPVKEQQADELFEAIYNKYGLFLATNILTKCTTKKIREIITSQPVKLTQNQMKSIFNKEPDLFRIYCEERIKHEDDKKFLNYAPIIYYIAQKNPKMFSELLKKYKIVTKLGRRTTKRVVVSQKEEILDKLEEYMEVLNHTALARKLGKDVVDKLIKKSFGEADVTSWRNIIQHYPKTQQFHIYKSAYDSVYHSSLGEDVECMSDEVFEMMRDSDMRHYYAKMKTEMENNPNYLKYVKPEYCLTKFMEQVNHMKSGDKANYVEIASFCCILNKDYDAFLKVCELVAVRLKNDDRIVRESFYKNFATNEKVMENFGEEHWNFIMAIAEISRSENELIWNEECLIASYLKFLILNNKSIKEVLEKQMDWYDVLTNYEVAKDPVVFKPIMTHFIEVGLVKPDPIDELEAPYFDCELAFLCRKFNERNPDHAIEIRNHPRTKESVKKVLQDSPLFVEYAVQEGIRYVVCQSVNSEEVKELKRIYFENFKTFGDLAGMMWFLKCEPKTLQTHFDDFLNNFNESNSDFDTKRVWYFIKKYADLKLDTRTINFCREKLEDEAFDNKERLARALTMLSTPSSHLEFIKTYTPTSDKVDLTNDEEEKLYKIRAGLYRLLHLVNAPANVLPVALEVCRGDYWRFALSPLYSCFYKLPENKTRTYIDKLKEKKAVSVRKHAMNLSCVIYDKEKVYSCLKNATVPSLVPTLKYFAKNPSSALWGLVEDKVCNLEKKELQAVQPALDIVVPPAYKSKFVKILWELFEKHESKECMKILLHKIDPKITQNFEIDVAINIIESSIFKFEESNKLIANILVHLESEDKFNVLSHILNEYKNNCWNDEDTQRLARRKLYHFICHVYEVYMKAERCDGKFVSIFSSLFKSIFSLYETPEEWILISLMSVKGETPEVCAKRLIELNSLFEEKCGKYAINLLATAINNFAFMYTCATDDDKTELCYGLFKNTKSVNDQILCLKLLPKEEPSDEKHYRMYKEIVENLKKATNEVIQMQINLFLKDDPDIDDSKEIDWRRRPHLR